MNEYLRDLTTREKEVVQQVATGARNKQIASQLGISERTVKLHLVRAHRKLGIRGRGELLLRWQDEATVRERITSVGIIFAQSLEDQR